MHAVAVAGVVLSALSLTSAKPAPIPIPAPLPEPTPPPSAEEAEILIARQAATPTTTCYTTLQSPLPSNFICGGHGTLASPAAITTTFPQGAEAQTDLCRDQCLQNPDCHDYSYRNTDGKCVLFSMDIRSMGYSAFSNRIDYFHRRCFTTSCSTITPSSTPANTFTCTTGGTSYTTSLTAPTPIFSPDGAPHDDQSQLIVPAPFNLHFYGKNARRLHVSINGFMSAGPNDTSQADSYNNQKLPWYFDFEASYIPNVWFGAYWDDLIVPATDPDNVGYGVFYEVTGTAPDRTMIFEWKTNRVNAGQGLFHFFIYFNENQPGRAYYIYDVLTDNAVNGTIGVQDYFGRHATEYSYQNAGAAIPGTRITWDGRFLPATYIAERPCPAAGAPA